MTLRTLPLIAATLVAVGLATPVAQAADMVGSIKYVGYDGAPLNLTERVAIEEGIFAAHGLDVEFVGASNGQQLAAALLGGSAQIGVLTTTAAAPLIRQGQCVTYLTSGARTYYNLLAQPDLDLPNADKPYPENLVDLRGKKIAINARGTALESMVNAVLAEAGVDPSEVTYIATGGSATAVAAFRNGQVDVMMAFPISEQLLQPGEYKDVARLMDIKEHNPLNNLTQVFSGTTCEYAEENPEVIEAFCAAVGDAYRFVNDPANRDAVIDVVEKTMRLDEPTATAFWDQYKGSWPSAEIDPASYAQQQILLPEGSELPAHSDIVTASCQAKL